MTRFPSDLRALAHALGGDIVGHQVLAPGPGHSPKDRSLAVKLSVGAPEGFVAFSHAGDDFASCRDYVKSKLGIPRDDWRAERLPQPSRVQAREANERLGGLIKTIVRDLRPIRKTPGEAYLREGRRIDVDAIADVLARNDAIGWHPSVLFRQEKHALDGKRLGAIVAVMTDPVTAKPTGGITRTYVHAGRKVSKAKGLGPVGVVRLSRDEEALAGLFLAEGLETALAGMSIGLRPMWSTGSTSTMAKFPVLDGVEALTILADHDENGAGERAAREVAARWRAAGREVRILRSDALGDLNDVMTGGFE